MLKIRMKNTKILQELQLMKSFFSPVDFSFHDDDEYDKTKLKDPVSRFWIFSCYVVNVKS